MLSKPDCGWTNIILGDETRPYPASYITDVPLDTLVAMNNALDSGQPFCCEYDAEGWMYTIVIDDLDAVIIKDAACGKETDVFSGYDIETAAFELIGDLLSDKHGWYSFLALDDIDNMTANEDRLRYETEIERLSALLRRKWQARWEGGEYDEMIKSYRTQVVLPNSFV